MLNNHTVIIGGTRGLGKTLVKLMQAEGHQLSVFGRSAATQTGENSIFYVQGDLTDEAQFLQAFQSLIKEKGKIKHLIFLQRYKGEGDRWQGELGISLDITRKIIDTFKSEFDSGKDTVSSITLVSSVMGRFANNSQPLSYSIAKAGLNHFVKYYAAELGPLGIRVNAVSPITFIKEESRKFYLEEKPEINALYEKIVPLKRMCTTDDVAQVIQFLASSKAAFISGQNIDVDGGLSIVSHETLAKTLSA